MSRRRVRDSIVQEWENEKDQVREEVVAEMVEKYGKKSEAPVREVIAIYEQAMRDTLHESLDTIENNRQIGYQEGISNAQTEFWKGIALGVVLTIAVFVFM